MAVSSNNFDETMPFTAVAAVSAGVLNVTATTLIACLPLTSALSGATYTGKCTGRVSGVTKSSATAFLAGAPLGITTAGLALAIASAGTIVNAYAYGDWNTSGATAGTTMDVILCLPWTV